MTAFINYNIIYEREVEYNWPSTQLFAIKVLTGTRARSLGQKKAGRRESI